jgi:predicted nucleic acid-binding Zn ribbon protein
VFKGSGFYKTDSRSKSTAASDAPKTDAPKTETKTETKSPVAAASTSSSPAA